MILADLVRATALLGAAGPWRVCTPTDDDSLPLLRIT